MSEQDFQRLLRFFKVVGDESRLRLVGLLATREHSVDELAAILQIKAPTVSHHLARLRELDLVAMRAEGNVHLYSLKGETLTDLSRDLLTRERMASLVDEVDGDQWERKVLRDFLVDDRLKEIPAGRKKRVVVLGWLAAKFDRDRPYPEREVNSVISRHHPDFATLRRELIGHGLLTRERGVYRRV
ncbi:MAG: metalloregulator ArsR/SmtB family transcription factor [Candidatus Sericytochromatia bacterium]|nr:metalloregulator ArsR/SmtB family transcription factor [Candidatus Tanganyikabacteria bacterium]